MSSVSICRRPTAALISSASSYAARTPSAIRSSGMPCEPECACSRVSQGRSRYARTTHSRAPSSRSATPNFEVAVAVRQRPDGAPADLRVDPQAERGRRGPAEATRASMRASSCGLSALTAMPRASASRSSAGVLAGESRTVRSAGTPGGPGQRQLAGARHLRADALVVQQPQHRHQRGGLHGEGVQHGRARCGDRGEGRPQRGGRLPDAGHVEQARRSAAASPSTSPCSTAARTAWSRRAAAAVARVSLESCMRTSQARRSTDAGTDQFAVLTRSIQLDQRCE